LTWKVEFDDRALKELRKLDPPVQRQILRFLRERVATTDDPKRSGRPLSGDRLGLWCYRLGPYRLVCRIEEDRLVVLVLAVGHRKEIYR
jgi:mRNA interferase RelE/StbE